MKIGKIKNREDRNHPPPLNRCPYWLFSKGYGPDDQRLFCFVLNATIQVNTVVFTLYFPENLFLTPAIILINMVINIC